MLKEILFTLFLALSVAVLAADVVFLLTLTGEEIVKRMEEKEERKRRK